MLSGFVTVSCLWGIGKVTVLKVLKSGEKSVRKLGNTELHDDDIKNQSFITSHYGHPQETDMTSL